MAHSPDNTQPRLPDYKPRGMSKGDKVAAWTMAFIIVLFGLVVLNHWSGNLINTNSFSGRAPAVHKTVKPSAHSKSTLPWYVVVNSSTGYVWWLNGSGGHFTHATAEEFISGHSNYHIYALKLRK